MHNWLDALLLVTWANGAPLLARLLLADRWAWPVDGGVCLRDGRRWLGASKTWRGWIVCVLTTPLIAALLGLSVWLGLLVALGAMLGDAAASFVKRRLGYRSSESAPLLDQMPESLIPALAVQAPLGLTLMDLVLVVGGFSVLNLLLTPLVVRLMRGVH